MNPHVVDDVAFLRYEVVNGRANVDELIARVRHRLVAAEAFVALRALDGLTPAERVVLAERERAARPSDVLALHEVADRRTSDRLSWRARWERMTEAEREVVRARNRAAYRARRALVLASTRHCASPTCETRFTPAKGDKRFCSGRCRNREKMNRYRRRKRAQA